MPDEKEKKRKEMVNIELICPMYHERLDFFLPNMIFDKEEWENNAFIEKYDLNSRYRDYKILTNQNYPAGFPLENIVYTIEGRRSVVISLRAMHRICCEDLFKKSIHFMSNPFVRWKVLNYDNSHGSLIKFMIHSKSIPVKYDGIIKILNNPRPIQVPIFHIDPVWNLDFKSGFLVYYLELINNNPSLKTMYIDSNTIEYISLNPSK